VQQWAQTSPEAAAAWIEAYIEESMWLDADLGKHGWSLDRMRPAATKPELAKVRSAA